MFYGQFILSKKGPLARIWLAAHWEKKLTKAQIFDMDIDKAVDCILEPKVKMALRTKGHLLLGVCKIYSRKTKYLLADCNDTCTRIRLAFRPYAVAIDLPEDQLVAPYDAITNPQVFHDFDAANQDISLNQSRYEDITLMENMAFANPDMYNVDNAFGFGDEDEIVREASAGGSELNKAKRISNGKKLSGLEENKSGNRIDISRFFEPENSDAAIPNDNAGTDSAAPAQIEPVGSPGPGGDLQTPPPVQMSPIPPPTVAVQEPDAHGMATPNQFFLPPLDEATMLGQSRQRVTRKRRRGLIIDAVYSIQPEDFKRQINDFKDTMRPISLAPPSKRMMTLKEEGTAEYLMTHSCLGFASKGLFEKIFQPNLQTRQHPDEECADPGITLVDHEEPPHEQPEPPVHLEPIMEDVEMERQHQDDLQPLPDAMDQQQPMDIDQPPADDHQFLEPFLPPPIREGNENADPIPIFDSVLTSPLVIPAVADKQMDGSGAQMGILAERNSSTPVPPFSSTPMRSPKKSRLSQQAQNDIAEGEKNLDVSRASQVSTTWDVKAQDIVTKLRSRMNWLRENPSMDFQDVINPKDTRKTVAGKFYALLELKKSQVIDFKQSEPYGPIEICGGPAFDIMDPL